MLLGRLAKTWMVCFWFILAGVGVFFCALVFLYILFFTRYWYAAIVYLCWFYYDRKTPYTGGYRILPFRYAPFITLLDTYFPSKIIKTVDLSPDKNYIFGCHPHGTVNGSLHTNFINPFSVLRSLLPGFTPYFATINLNLNIPFFREYVLGLGAISCNKDSLEYFLNEKEKGKMLLLFIGGARETFYASPGTFQLILNKRKGFVKLALTTGTPLVPVLGFGDNEMFHPIEFSPESIIYKLQRWLLKKLNFFLYIPTTIFPKSVELTTIIGKPIDVPHMLHPNNEEIEYYHSIYRGELIKLFNSHKKDFKQYKELELVIVE